MCSPCLFLPALPPVRSQKLDFGHNYLPSIKQVVGHCQRLADRWKLNEVAPICSVIAVANRPVAAILFPGIEHTRGFLKGEKFNESSKDLKPAARLSQRSASKVS
jgi:hypothetical protein